MGREHSQDPRSMPARQKGKFPSALSIVNFFFYSLSRPGIMLIVNLVGPARRRI